MNRRTFMRQSTLAAGAIAAVAIPIRRMAHAADQLAGSGNEGLSLAYRIVSTQWKNDAQFGKLLDLLKAHRAGVDEVALFELENTGVETGTQLVFTSGHP
jgi:hypothetical protein